MVGGNHRRAALGDEIAEQPELGGKIMRNIRMVVHVVARQIGKTAGADAYAVEPILIKPVRRSLEGKMGTALARDLVELPMQRNRIRRRQRSVKHALR